MSADDNELAACFFAVLRDRLALPTGTARDAAAVCAGALRSEAVSAAVLIRLAMDRGVLKDTGYKHAGLEGDPYPLYRVVES